MPNSLDSDVGPGTYYLMGKLAWLEQDLIHQFSQNMNAIGFFQINCPEIFRTLVVVRNYFYN